MANHHRKLVPTYTEIDQQFLTLDVSGHYARPEVFTFNAKVK